MFMLMQDSQMRQSLTIVLALSCNLSVSADVITTFDDAVWESGVNEHVTINFTAFADGTPITDQYADMGIAFSGPSFVFASVGFVNDGWGLHGPSGIRIHFDEPQSWIAVHHGGTALFKLYNNGELIGTSGFDPVGGIDSFLGVWSTIPFDEVFITTQPIFGPHVGIDDLHWGGVPAPGALGLLGIAGFSSRRRRR